MSTSEGYTSTHDSAAAAAGPDSADFLIAPALPEGTTVELTTAIRADGLNADAFALFARLAVSNRVRRRNNGADGGCPALTQCHVYHDHGQTCPVLTICHVNTYVVEPDTGPEV